MQTAQGYELRAVSDQEHLASAAAEGWGVFTQDADFLRLHAEGFGRAGIAYAHQQTAICRVVRGLMPVYQVLELGDMRDHVEFL